MPDTTVTNWFGDLVSHPKVVVEASSMDDIAAILKNPDQYPSPVRAIGSNHSTERCGVADGGFKIVLGDDSRLPEEVRRLHVDLVRAQQADPDAVDAFVQTTRSILQWMRRLRPVLCRGL